MLQNDLGCFSDFLRTFLSLTARKEQDFCIINIPVRYKGEFQSFKTYISACLLLFRVIPWFKGELMFYKGLSNYMKSLRDQITPMLKNTGSNEVHHFGDVNALWAYFPTSATSSAKVDFVSSRPKFGRRTTEFDCNASWTTEHINTHCSHNRAMVDTEPAVDAGAD
jgi:hypothetical protein